MSNCGQEAHWPEPKALQKPAGHRTELCAMLSTQTPCLSAMDPTASRSAATQPHPLSRMMLPHAVLNGRLCLCAVPRYDRGESRPAGRARNLWWWLHSPPGCGAWSDTWARTQAGIPQAWWPYLNNAQPESECSPRTLKTYVGRIFSCLYTSLFPLIPLQMYSIFECRFLLKIREL